MSRSLVTAVLLVGLGRSPAGAQGSAEPHPRLPTTGVDYTGIDQFYAIADLLSKDIDPSVEQWQTLLETPGYRLVLKQNSGIRRQMEIALKPSRSATRDSILKADSDAQLTLKHLIRAASMRAEIDQVRRALERSIGDSIGNAVTATARYLPPGTTAKRPAPFIAFAVFGEDGYAMPDGVLLDPLYVRNNGLVSLLSHEFHHTYTGLLDRTIQPRGQPPADVSLALAIIHLRNEGIADQIDKPHPLPPQSPSLDWYVKRYNDTYDRTPAILRSLDSLLVAVADSPAVARAAGQRARNLLWSNSHPNGAYMAREIVETFGIDSLMPALYNPFALVRAYSAAERKRGNPPPFSAKSIELLSAMEKRYVNP